MYYKIITADIIKHVTQHGGVLIHQVNCQRTAGRGLALQIRNRWPGWYDIYRLQAASLGDISIYTDHGWPRTFVGKPLVPIVTIISLYAQQGYGTHQRQTDYSAFTTALTRLHDDITRTGLDAATWMAHYGGELYVPMGIGCGLAGGDWHTILPILVAELPTNFTICQLPK